MVFAATLVALTLSPIVVKDKTIAYSAKADVAGSRRTVVVLPKHARVVAQAIEAGAGQDLVVRQSDYATVLVSSRDETLKASLQAADADDLSARRAQDPLGFALSDLAWAEQMLACAKADVLIHDSLPADHVSRHEAEVTRLAKIVTDLSQQTR